MTRLKMREFSMSMAESGKKFASKYENDKFQVRGYIGGTRGGQGGAAAPPNVLYPILPIPGKLLHPIQIARNVARNKFYIEPILTSKNFFRLRRCLIKNFQINRYFSFKFLAVY